MVRGLNALITTVSTPRAAPVVTAAQLRGGNAGCARGAPRLIAEGIRAAREAGATGIIVARGDSAFYSGSFVTACRRRRGAVLGHGADGAARSAAPSPPSTRTPGCRSNTPNAIYDQDTDTWICDAQIARVPYTAFATTRAHRSDGELIVRRVKQLNPQAAQGQGELFSAYRYHAVFTNSPFSLVQAESQHRGHAVIEQINADLIDGPLAHLPCADFQANAAWLQLAVTAHALTRALGTLACTRHALARGATIRAEIIQVAARPARSGRDQITWHLPQNWPWHNAWQAAFQATTHRPPPGTSRLTDQLPTPGLDRTTMTWISRIQAGGCHAPMIRNNQPKIN